MSVFGELLRESASAFASLSESQIAQLEQHHELLGRWNKKINLTRIERVDESVELHYCESLFLGSQLPAGPLKIADVGSGAGFPGIPIAVSRPEVHVTLIESHQRKAVFLKEATRCIQNLTVLPMRAEAVKETFDWVVSRAVSLEDLRKVATHLASNFALLTGELTTARQIPVPCSASGQILNQRRIAIVSRETLGEGFT